jgi:hypothetical protein
MLPDSSGCFRPSPVVEIAVGGRRAGGFRLNIRLTSMATAAALLAATMAYGQSPFPPIGGASAPRPQTQFPPVGGGQSQAAAPSQSPFPSVSGGPPPAVSAPSAMAPAPMSPAMSPAPGGFAPPQQQQPPCMDDFMKLRGEFERRAKAVEAAGKRKPAPDEACKLISSFVDAGSRLIKFVEVNTRSCGIPPDILTNLKTSHVDHVQLRTRVCNAAAQPRSAPGPTFSDVLGSPALPDTTTTTRAGGSTFDTLSGNALAR